MSRRIRNADTIKGINIERIEVPNAAACSPVATTGHKHGNKYPETTAGTQSDPNCNSCKNLLIHLFFKRRDYQNLPLVNEVRIL